MGRRKLGDSKLEGRWPGGSRMGWRALGDSKLGWRELGGSWLEWRNVDDSKLTQKQLGVPEVPAQFDAAPGVQKRFQDPVV